MRKFHINICYSNIIVQMKTPEEIAIQKEKRRVYMRNYKRKQYAEHHEQMKETQRLYYHTKINKKLNLKNFNIWHFFIHCILLAR